MRSKLYFQLLVVCRGYAGSSRIQTFDGESFARYCPCSHVLVKDTFGLNFEVTVEKQGCHGGFCTSALSFTDKFLKQTAKIYKDHKVRFANLNIYKL